MFKDPLWILVFIAGMICGSLASAYFGDKDYKGAAVQGVIGGSIFYFLISIFTRN